MGIQWFVAPCWGEPQHCTLTLPPPGMQGSLGLVFLLLILVQAYLYCEEHPQIPEPLLP